MKRAQQTGTLNLQSKGLQAFPADLCNFSELRLIDNFWEAYDLNKIDLSNNEIESIPEEIGTQEVSDVLVFDVADYTCLYIVYFCFTDYHILQHEHKQADLDSKQLVCHTKS